MHSNLERRFTELEVARTTHEIKLLAFSSRFHLLFAALAEDMGLTWDALGKRLNWEPIPEVGNAIMRGDAEPSREDCYLLLMVYLGAERVPEPLDVPRCDRCGWPLVERMEDGCTAGNCCMRGDIR